MKVFWQSIGLGLFFLFLSVRSQAQDKIAQWTDEYCSGIDSVMYCYVGNTENIATAFLKRDSDEKPILLLKSESNKSVYSVRWHQADTQERFWLVGFTSKNKQSIKITAIQNGSSTSPKNFQCQYRLSKGEWKNLGSKITLEENKKKTSTYTLPPEAEHREWVWLRWKVTNNEAIKSKSTINDGGTSHISLTITGVDTEVPYLTQWLQNAHSTDWNDVGNWSAGVPRARATASIPSNCLQYPVLKNTDKAICDTVLFATDTYDQVAQLGNSYLLNYNHAVVEVLPSPNQYHLLAPPLHNMYSGDFFTKLSFSSLGKQASKRSQPKVWIKLYQTKNPEKGNYPQNTYWSGYFNNLDYSIPLGSGICIWVDDEDIPNDERTAENLKFVFPKDSVRYAYYDAKGQITRFSDGLSRLSHTRFAYEELPTYSSTEGSFEVPIQSDYYEDEVFESAIVGNPFLCPLNFSSFQAANQDKIEAVYRIWGGDSFTNSILYGSEAYPLDDNNNQYIAPLQAFVVIKKASYGSTRKLEKLFFSPDMAEQKPHIALRSASAKDATSGYSVLKKTKKLLVVKSNSYLEINVPSCASTLELRYYNLLGTLLEKTSVPLNEAGVYTLPLPNVRGVVLVQLQVDKEVYTEKILL